MTQPQPPLAALIWAGGSGGPARVVRRLEGGTHAITHLLETGRPGGQVVLRRYPAGDDAAGREARILEAFDGLDGWAPRLIDADPDGVRFGEPAVLISRLAGTADITSVAPADAAEQLGRVLARIHAAPMGRLGHLRDGMAAAQTTPGTAETSASGAATTATAGEMATVGAAILAGHGHRLRGGPDGGGAELVLTHYDYWSGNVLWEQGRISGVVDWSGAGRAPRGFDVGWCRLDLVLLHGKVAAEVFLEAYQRAAGTLVPDVALWDLFALDNSYRDVETWVGNYHGLGRTDLTAGRLRERHTGWTRDRISAWRGGDY